MGLLVDQLSKYAAYHRDPRNIATHFVGVPMIVVAVAVLLSRPSVGFFSPIVLVAVGVLGFYFRCDVRFGVAMSALMAAAMSVGRYGAALETLPWLALGVGLFVVGWVIQFVGHYFEGKKPAFFDDLLGLVVGPLFVVAEFGFLLGLRPDVKAAVEARSGPVRRS